MEQQEIIEGNLLIIKFMAIEAGMITETKFQYWKISAGFFVSTQELKYHSSWDWLMPVIEKIESMGNHFPIEKNGALVSAPYPEKEERTGLYCITQYISASTKIEASWKVAIEFIKWYNDELKIKS